MKACNCYEDEISGGENQVYCIKYMCSAVSSRITILDSEDYLNVAMLLAKYALNLTRLSHRCEVLCFASHLFNSPQYYNEQRLVWCLEKCVTLVETLDFYAPSKLVQALHFPLETSKYFKLKNVTKVVQNKLDKLTPLLSKGNFYTFYGYFNFLNYLIKFRSYIILPKYYYYFIQITIILRKYYYYFTQLLITDSDEMKEYEEKLKSLQDYTNLLNK